MKFKGKAERFNEKAEKSILKAGSIVSKLGVFMENNESDLPAGIDSKNRSFLLIIIALFLFSVIGGISGHSLFFFVIGIMADAAVLGLYFYRKKEIKKRGYKTMHFITREYAYLTKLNRQPTGIMMVCVDPGCEDNLYHMAISGRADKIPLNWNITLYMPKDAAINKINEVMYVSTYYGYEMKGEARNQ